MDSREYQRRLRQLNRAASERTEPGRAVKPVRLTNLDEPGMICDVCHRRKPLSGAYVYHDEWNSRDEHICGDCRSAEKIGPGHLQPYQGRGRFVTDVVANRKYSEYRLMTTISGPRPPSDYQEPGSDDWWFDEYEPRAAGQPRRRRGRK